jgi:type IX secretion system PorP/SprF family membrane protein
MMRMKRILLFCTVAFAIGAKAQQMSLNSQYLFNEMMLNPAATGIKDYVPVQFNFRKQWTNFPGSPTTQFLSAHSSIAKHMGFGGSLVNDVSGPSRRTGFNINTAYHLQLDAKSEHMLGFGIGVSLTQHLIDVTKLETYLPDDPAVLRGFNNQMVPDANMGVYYRFKDKGFAGFSAYNLAELNRDLYNFETTFGNPMKRTYYLFGGYHFNLGQNFGIKPTILGQMIETTTWQLDGSLLFTYKNICWLGASYRHQDAVACLVGGQAGPFKFGYSYDFTLSDIGQYSAGSHELFLELQIRKSSDSGKTPWLRRNRVYDAR